MLPSVLLCVSCKGCAIIKFNLKEFCVHAESTANAVMVMVAAVTESGLEAAHWQYSLQHNTTQCGGGGNGECSSNGIGSGVSGASNWPTGEGESNNQHRRRKKSNSAINCW